MLLRVNYKNILRFYFRKMFGLFMFIVCFVCLKTAKFIRPKRHKYDIINDVQKNLDNDLVRIIFYISIFLNVKY